MRIKYLGTLLGIVVAAPCVQAHEIWIERDGTGPARIYLGEPEQPLPAGGDPEFDHLKAPRVSPLVSAPLVRKAGFLEAAVTPGDVRAQDDAVFAPWGSDGKREGVAYYARSGRMEARAAMPLEIAPVAAGSNRFVLLRDGKPVGGTTIKIVSPDKWSKLVPTDTLGTILVPTREKGRYLLSVAVKDNGSFKTSLGEVAVLHSISTTTFVMD